MNVLLIEDDITPNISPFRCFIPSAARSGPLPTLKNKKDIRNPAVSALYGAGKIAALKTAQQES
jgi:hypothetical protein